MSIFKCIIWLHGFQLQCYQSILSCVGAVNIYNVLIFFIYLTYFSEKVGGDGVCGV